jgi:nucleoid-associated protein YgaU
VRQRLLVLLLGAGIAGTVLLSRVGWQAVAGWRAAPAGTGRPDQLLAGLCAGTAAALLGWACAGAALALVATGSGAVAQLAAPWSARVAPAVLRSAVAATLGGSLAMGTLAGVHPSDPSTTRSATSTAASTATSRATSTPAPGAAISADHSGWTPEPPPRPPTTPAGDVALVSASATAGRQLDEHVTVRRGDTLWSITARHLGSQASAIDVAREWPRWFAANRHVIGADPDRLLPGQLLRPPDSSPASRRHR